MATIVVSMIVVTTTVVVPVTRTGNYNGGRPGNINGRPGNINGRPGNINGGYRRWHQREQRTAQKRGYTE
jgi:hypothetical protein